MKIAIHEQKTTKGNRRRFAVSVEDDESRCFHHICVTNEPTAKLVAAAMELLIATGEGRALVLAAKESYWNQRKIW